MSGLCCEAADALSTSVRAIPGRAEVRASRSANLADEIGLKLEYLQVDFSIPIAAGLTVTGSLGKGLVNV